MEAATPFFGAKISLISKSEIRYEGILYTIDPKESTIALAKVRSFGTENRQAERPVPPRDEIFEFIIFRASDIKDLVVDDAPQSSQAQPAQVFDDPAIVQSSNSAPGTSSSIPSGPTKAQAQSSKPTENGQTSQAADSSKKSQTSVQAPKPAWSGVNVQNNSQTQPSQNRNQQNQNRSNNNQVRQFDQRGNGFSQGGRVGFRSQGQNFRPQGFNQQSRYNNNNFRMGGGFQRGGRGGMVRGTFQPRNNGPIKFAPLPDGEFDFEKAHSDFQMLEEKLKALKLNGQVTGQAELPPIEGIPASAITVSALEEEEEIPSEPCYNKKTSFFDKISCEAVERQKGTVKRVDWKAERSLNKETFGVPSARPNQRYFNSRRGGYGFNNNRNGFNNGRGAYTNRRRYNNHQQNRQSSGNQEPPQSSSSVEASA